MKKSPSKMSLFFTSTCTFFLISCASLGPKSPTIVGGKAKVDEEISVMNYNVENLFDNIHDENRDDHTYLPLSKKQNDQHKAICEKISNTFYRGECLNLDWSDEVVAAKLQNLAQIILSVDTNGPDVLILQEVENNRILSRLNKEYLSKAGYQTEVLIEGPDERGIDIAVLSRLPLVGTPELHKIPYVAKDEKDKAGMAKSRGILEVKLKLPNQETLTVLGAHFPSQGNPRYWREQAVAFMSKLIAERSTTGMVVASGDLNITHKEESETRFFGTTLSEVAQVSHLVGCKKCDGTHNYRKDWSFLDVMLFSKNLSESGTASYKLIPDTISVVNHHPAQLWGSYPKRFSPDKKDGVSDHFPLYARLILRDQNQKSPAK